MAKNSGMTRGGRPQGSWLTLGGYMSRLSNDQIALIGRLERLTDVAGLQTRIIAARNNAVTDLNKRIAALPLPTDFANEKERKRLDDLKKVFLLTDEDTIRFTKSKIGKKLDASGFAKDIASAVERIVGKDKIKSYDLSFDNGSASISIRVGGIQIERTFRVTDNGITVHHDLFTIPRSMQGKGISKTAFREMYKHYKAAGVTEIDVFANIDVGGYTWARYGFRTPYISAYSLVIGNKPAREILDDFYRTHKKSEMFRMKTLTEKMPKDDVKSLLLGKSWNGYLDLSDSEQRKDFEDYLYSDGKKKK